MARIVFADDGIEFDGTTPDKKPLGGVESSVVNLCETLAARGHEVLVRNKCAAPIVHNGVDWAPIDRGLPECADLYIANRGDKLIPLLPKAGRCLFWIHNPAQYLLKWRYLRKLWARRPVIVFIGEYHATTCPDWVPDGGRRVIPYGTPDEFRTAEPGQGTPVPRAVFTSNPLRSLDWILERWERDIQPKVPGAELHVFAGAATYGAVGDAKAEAMKRVLDQAEALRDRGVVLRGPVPKSQLVAEFRQARCMLYRGDLNETYCLAVGEAQAMGVPAVVQDLGSMGERVRHGETGTVAQGDIDFSAAAVALLSDESHWQSQHDTALSLQRSWTWTDAAEAFEEYLP
ncbi:glycosyltransferase [Magnetospira sp. QH-2]|uniref:glycosyltransferase n=1 Tax=Magnetospira sp. (strain QH-2) TaxID=1288970 RepID=UPI0003E80FC5|nr:glycosyltransferase [Magnetospira sp. QH-2]CCQ73897.1 putative GT4 : distantly related to 1L-myo-inositol-1-P a-N-acetylglucoaminyltransferase [Magnetospira sp. QH-2]